MNILFHQHMHAPHQLHMSADMSLRLAFNRVLSARPHLSLR